MKKWKLVLGTSVAGILILLVTITGMISAVIGGVESSKEKCVTNSFTDTAAGESGAVPTSIEEFVKSHKEAYILSWKAGGFLPSASIAQTMVENGFNFTNPSGTSFWQAHNMGGVKTSRLSDFPVTVATFGSDSVDITGTKPGTNVGDGTGGAYTWFKDYNAGIVGKAEFMAHQTLYTGAINNTDGYETLTAIYQGGWATDPTYLTKLHTVYSNLGKQFQWLDKEAIDKYGSAPYKASNGSSSGTSDDGSSVEISNSKRSEIVNLAKSQLGVPYVWGGRSWDVGLDCSGLTMLTYQKVGIELPPTSETQSRVVKRIDKSQAQRGDLVFWGSVGQSHHVAIYLGNDQVIEEPDVGQVCKISNLYGDYWIGTIEGLGDDDGSDSDSDQCVSDTDTSGEISEANSAPTLEIPAEYADKVTLPAPDSNNYAGNRYPFGQCTWGAYNRMAQIGKRIEWFSGNGGHGGYWWQSAITKGYTVKKGVPAVGWAASYMGIPGYSAEYGHIAVVEYVNDDGTILISETNVVQPGSGTRSWRVLSKDMVEKLYFIEGRG